MKRTIFTLFLMFSVFLGVWSGYESQGFVSYSEQNGQINFSCAGQCMINLGAKTKSNFYKISGLKGEGQVVLGVVSQQQLIPLASSQVSENLSRYVDSYGGQPIPDGVQMVLVVQWNVSATQARLTITQANFIDRIGVWRKEFRASEGQTFYGINLRYGAKFLGTSVVVIGYRIFAIVLVVLLIMGKRNMRNVIGVAVALFLLIAIRNQIDYTKTTVDNLNSYTFAASGQKSYGNLGDYYEFLDKARKQIWIDEDRQKSCKVFLECTQPRPFCAHMGAVFTKPCEEVKDINQSDYQIYYKKTPTQNSGSKLLEFNGSFLYQTK